MRIKKTLLTITLSLIFAILICSAYLSQSDSLSKKNQLLQKEYVGDDEPPSLQLYNLIENASDSFNIPRHILYNVAFLETRYQGPFDWDYNPYLTSSAGAQGPMQIITRYAHKYAGRKVTPQELRTNLKLNVDVSCKMLLTLYEMYHQWDLALGFYNTGYPIVNKYASLGTCMDYRKNWITIE